jgi:glycosyltransferase involved in cell wall biosynthesis
MEIELSIIIPCKNEEVYIGKLLDCLLMQSLPHSVEIIVSDAGSTDGTIDIINSYIGLLPNLKIIGGGLPSVGRNLGVLASSGSVLLFIDSDTYFKKDSLVMDSLNLFKLRGASILGCLLNIENNFRIKVIYGLCNIIFYLSKFDSPFVVGSYMMISRDKFISIGGFDESLMHCEDYFLSKQVSSSEHIILNEYIYTDDRRFRKLGIFDMVKYFIRNMIKRDNKGYFKKDIGYWL